VAVESEQSLGENQLHFKNRQALSELPLAQIDEESIREEREDPELLDPRKRSQTV